MGFLNKLWNFVTGKGYKETEIKEITKEQTQQLLRAQQLTPTQEQTIPNYTQETPQKQTIVPQEKQTTTKKIKKQTLTTIQNKLTKGAIGRTRFPLTTNLNELNQPYQELLRNSTININDKHGQEDQALIQILIENRQKLQHRFSAEIIITTTGGNATMNIDGILADNLTDITNYIQEGMTYNSQELKEALNKAMQHFEKQYGSIGGNITTPPEEQTKITGIQIEMTFA